MVLLQTLKAGNSIMINPPILRLPRELRYRVYKLVFDFHSVDASKVGPPLSNKHFFINPPSNRGGHSFKSNEANHILALRFVTKQVSDEASVISYGSTRFEIADLKYLYSFLTGIGKRNRDLINTLHSLLHVKNPSVGRKASAFITQLSSLEGFQTMHFTITFQKSNPGPSEWKTIYDTLQQLKGRCTISLNYSSDRSVRDPGRYGLVATCCCGLHLLVIAETKWTCEKDQHEWKGRQTEWRRQDNGKFICMAPPRIHDN